MNKNCNLRLRSPEPTETVVEAEADDASGNNTYLRLRNYIF